MKGCFRSVGTESGPKYNPDRTRSVAVGSVSLRSKMPPIVNQGGIGSCTSRSLASLFQELRHRSGFPDDWQPSAMFLHYNARLIENNGGKWQDGCSIAGVINSLMRQGTCHEKLWPYADSQSRARTNPPHEAYVDAMFHTLDLPSWGDDNPSYAWMGIEREHDGSFILDNWKRCLIEQVPFELGIIIHDNLRLVNNTLTIPTMPVGNVEGHAVSVVGFDESRSAFQWRNTWGTRYGDGGYAWMPYEFARNPNFTFDAVRLNRIGEKKAA